MTTETSIEAIPVEVTYWSDGGASRDDARLTQTQPDPAAMRFVPGGRFYAGRLRLPATGTLTLNVVSPRPLRIWLDGALILDESLAWFSFQREVRAAITIPVVAHEAALRVEAGNWFSWPSYVDDHCPSRNRAAVRAALRLRYPDRMQLAGRVLPGVQGPALSVRFLASQFHRDGVTWQKVMVRPLRGFSPDEPSVNQWSMIDEPAEVSGLSSAIAPGRAEDHSSAEELKHGLFGYFVPVANALDSPAPLRAVGEPETRVEPRVDIVRILPLRLEGPRGRITVDMPAFESHGRLAPCREFRPLAWPSYAEARIRLPRPVLPDRLKGLESCYNEAWRMLYDLILHPAPDSGMPNSFVRTAKGFFPYQQFVWDSSFTAMCTAYGWRELHPYATLDTLYAHQSDGGYIHRETDTREALPLCFEPDFGPNPPLMSIAEWAIAGLTGNTERLARVYPALKANHTWIRLNRRLPDGTYWTTGLANGLDNSPSLGEGYPDLTAQMAHEAEVLAKIARLLGFDGDAEAWEREYREIGDAINAHLWSERMQIYSTSLPGGGHNPNKVVTAFWPLWAGIVPPDRVEALARHLKDPASFWRHHPIPSLAADSPHYVPGGAYWLGSTWAPTNYASIKGFFRAGRRDLARETALLHLQRIAEVFQATGHLWENYCAERSERGSQSGPDYSWTALGPIALLMEVVIGIEADALHNTLRWHLPDEERIGVDNLAFGKATVSLQASRQGSGRVIQVNTDQSFVLEIIHGNGRVVHSCIPGHNSVSL